MGTFAQFLPYLELGGGCDDGRGAGVHRGYTVPWASRTLLSSGSGTNRMIGLIIWRSVLKTSRAFHGRALRTEISVGGRMNNKRDQPMLWTGEERKNFNS